MRSGQYYITPDSDLWESENLVKMLLTDNADLKLGHEAPGLLTFGLNIWGHLILALFISRIPRGALQLFIQVLGAWAWLFRASFLRGEAQDWCHEGNIRYGGKTVHIVFKYLSRSVGVCDVTLPPLLPPCCWSMYKNVHSFKDDVTHILLLGFSSMIVFTLYKVYVGCLGQAVGRPLFILSYSAPKFGVCARPFVGIGFPTPYPQASLSPPLIGPKGARSNTLLWVKGWGDPIQTTGKKAWHSVYSVPICILRKSFRETFPLSVVPVIQFTLSCFSYLEL